MDSNSSVTPSDSASNVPSTQPTSFTGGRGARGRGRGRGSRVGRGGLQPGGPKSHPPATHLPASSEFQTIERRPVPQHLSTVPSPTRDDPMFVDDFVISGADRLRPTKQFPQISLDHQAYMSLVRTVYSVILTSDHNFSKAVPEPLFMYYCVQALWYRYLFLASAYGNYQANVNTLDRMRSVVWNLPDPLKRYLDGIGTTRAPDGQMLRISTDILSELESDNDYDFADFDGTYGRATSANHRLYATFPSPFVAVYNICAWLSAADGTGNAWHSTLPGDLRPDPNGDDREWRVTDNISAFVSGNGRSLSNKQKAVLRNNGFDYTNAGGAHFSGPTDEFLYKASAVVYISSEIANIVGFKISRFDNTNPSGTMAVIPWVKPDNDDDIRNRSDATLVGLDVRSSYDIASQLSSAALFAAYRFDRESSRGANNQKYFPFELWNPSTGNLLVPTQAYFDSINNTFTAGNSDRINRHYFDAGPVARRDILASVLTNFVSR